MSIAWSTDLIRHLPGEDAGSLASRQVHHVAYLRLQPTPVAAPRRRDWCAAVAQTLGLGAAPPAAAAVLAGNRLCPGMQPFAAAYGGHQFGVWAGQLGDGRAITLGQVDTPGGLQEVQLKGAGRTPFSRHADGRAVLRSTLREYVVGEALQALGVPSSRALGWVTTGEAVVRDRFYRGEPAPEPGAIICRVAPSWLRFGSLELPASRNDTALLSALVDYVHSRFYPALPARQPAALLDAVCQRSEDLVVHWMRVGFVHGVLNTDNMSLLGLGIDYGPFGFLEGFDPAFTPNTTDLPGRRYAYAAQPQIVAENLARLAQALLPLAPQIEPLRQILQQSAGRLQDKLRFMWLAKLGLVGGRGGASGAAADDALIADLLAVLTTLRADMTLFFRWLAAQAPAAVAAAQAAATAAQLQPVVVAAPPAAAVAQLGAWCRRYAERLQQDAQPPDLRAARMNRVNPARIPRNLLLQACIAAAEAGDDAPTRRLQQALQRPYDDLAEFADLTARQPDWDGAAEACSMLSCSS